MIPAGFRRRWPPLLLGLLCFALVLFGASILAAFFVVPAWLGPDASLRTGAMAVGALLALPPLLAYFWVPRLVGSLDPQPFRQLALAFVFGAFAASGFSTLFNTWFERALVALGRGLGRNDAADIAAFLGATFGAPLIEELWKGLAVVFAFRLCRRGPDVLQDGVVLATFSGIGFATVENVVYYARAALDEVVNAREGAIAAVVVVRGVVSPWGHPLYAALTGFGLGLGREHHPRRARFAAPLLGYAAAAVLHALWNGTALLSDGVVDSLLPLAAVFVVLFALLFGVVITRQSHIVRHELRPEVQAGILTPEEVALVASPLSRLHAARSHGGFAGRRFVATAARLAFARRQAGKAAPGSEEQRAWEASCDALRRELGRLRSVLAGSARSPVF